MSDEILTEFINFLPSFSIAAFKLNVVYAVVATD